MSPRRGGPRYSPAEHAALCALYPAAPRAAVLAALPDRSWASVAMHARLSGVRRARRERPWTGPELRRLADLRDASPRRLRGALRGRTWRAIRGRLGREGMAGGPGGVPQGHVALLPLARRERMTVATLLGALAHGSVQVRRIGRVRYVDPDDARAAIRAWDRARPRAVEDLARRLRCAPAVLRAALRAAGHRPPPRRRAVWRVALDAARAALDARRARWRSLDAQARRAGCSARWLRGVLRAQGVRGAPRAAPPPGRGGGGASAARSRWRLSDAEVDLAVMRAGGVPRSRPSAPTARRGLFGHARRRGHGDRWLRRRLLAAGLAPPPKGSPWLLTDAEVDAALASLPATAAAARLRPVASIRTAPRKDRSSHHVEHQTA